MDKWKCTVCGYVLDSENEPKKCVYCGADPHKMKALFKLLKRRFEFID